MFTEPFVLGPNGRLIRVRRRSQQRPRCGTCGRPIESMPPGTPVPSAVLLCRECHNKGMHTRAFYDDKGITSAERRRR